jgi:hypothetical protein
LKPTLDPPGALGNQILLPDIHERIQGKVLNMGEDTLVEALEYLAGLSGHGGPDAGEIEMLGPYPAREHEIVRFV